MNVNTHFPSRPLMLCHHHHPDDHTVVGIIDSTGRNSSPQCEDKSLFEGMKWKRSIGL